MTVVRQTCFYTQVAPLVAQAHAEQRVCQPRRRGRRKRTVVTGYLIIDDSTHAKRYARAQESLGSHYSGSEKKVVNGRSLYQSVYVLEGQQLPLTPRMYRRKVTCQAERRALRQQDRYGLRRDHLLRATAGHPHSPVDRLVVHGQAHLAGRPSPRLGCYRRVAVQPGDAASQAGWHPLMAEGGRVCRWLERG